MLSKTQQKVFDVTIKDLQNNTDLKELTANKAFRDYLILQSVLYEQFYSVMQDEKLGDEKRLRAGECLKLVESTLNFFTEYKNQEKE